MSIKPDARGKVYRRTTDGVVDYITVREALAEVNELMMVRQGDASEMSSEQGRHAITYKDGTKVLLVEVDAPKEPVASPQAVAVQGKTYIVGPVVPALAEAIQVSKYSRRLPHPAYVLYWSTRNGKRFGPSRIASSGSRQGTVGLAIWEAVSS